MKLTAISIALLTALGAVRAQDAPQLDAATRLPNDQVITATRLRQSLGDVPAAVTLITREDLRRLGITNVMEALRLVPGMHVSQVTGNDWRINYHGTNILVPRRLNVLIDGVSVFRPAFARVDWAQLPVAIDDIDRIEVVRGPNSAVYGPNSFQGIVNIITAHPADTPRLSGRVSVATDDTYSALARIAGTVGHTTARLSVSYDEDRGYGFLSRVREPHDSTRMLRVDLSSASELGELGSLGVVARTVGGLKEVPFADAAQRSFPDQTIRDSYLGITWNDDGRGDHALQVRLSAADMQIRQEWRSCPPAATLLPELFDMWRANPAYARAILAGRVPTGGSAQDNAIALRAIAALRALGAGALTPICSTPNQNQNEQRYDIELQDTFVASHSTRFVFGLGLRHDTGASDTFTAGRVDNSSYRLFATAQHEIRNGLSLHGGAYYERDQLTGTSLSPRAAVTYRATPSTSWRLAYSEGTRSPDVLEQRAFWTYPVSDFSPPLRGVTSGRFYQSAVATGGLKPERIQATELGWLYEAEQRTRLDVRVFNERLTDLISEKLQLSDFRPSNTGAVTLRGAEFAGSTALTRMLRLDVAYSYLDNLGATNRTERTQYSRHSGFIALGANLGAYEGALAFYGATGDGLAQSDYGRIDLRVARSLRAMGLRWTVAGLLQHYTVARTTYFRDVNDALTSTRTDDTRVLITLTGAH
jgi:iron complex outermembrane receptor protein